MHYITNYATKNDMNFNQILLKSAMIKKMMNDAQHFEMQISSFSNSKFAMKCFNVLTHDREINFVQMTNFLLKLKSFFIISKNFFSLNF